MSIASLYPSINPSLLLDFANSKVLDPRITFTRTTTATYYDGVTTAKAEENLYLYSQQLDTTAYWVHTNITVTANATTAPDGTSTADSILETTTNGQHRIYSLLTVSGTNTISIFAKANGRNYIALWFSGVDKGKFFNITAGGGGSVGNNFVNAPDGSSITYLGNDWYRCTVTVNGLTGTESGLCNLSTDGSTYIYAGDVTKGAYLWGFQLEQRSSATAYTATTTQAITNYIPVLQTAAAGQARFDHNPTTGESLGLLIEEARTNSITYSSAFNNAAWTKLDTSVTTNATTAPDGTNSAISAVPSTTTSSDHLIYQSFTGTAEPYTHSVYAKANGYNWIYLRPQVSVSTTYASFNLSNGTVGTVDSGVTATITSVGNGWYRCTATRTQGTSSNYFGIGVANADNHPSFAGNGFSGIFIWGAQLEAGSFATSYIPTVASSVTRNADAASMTGTNFSSWFNNGEGTVYFEAQPMYVGTASASLNSWLWDGTNSNIISIGQNAGYGQALYVDALVRINGSDAAYGYTATGVTTTSAFKSIAAYEFNNTGAYLNGASFLTDTSCTIPVVNQWKFGGNYGASNTSNGWVRKLSYYPQRLSATNLAALTT